ncbi:MAG TPA: hypothetical protein PKD10_06795 [Paracoccaceae bacterium]|nr:hypothetical protein [Paracoccaceae bacterium]
MRAELVAHAGLVVAGLVSFVLMGAGQSLYGPAVPVFARDFGIGTGQAGFLVSAHWIGAAAGVALMYVAGDRVTPRMTLAAMATGAGGIALGAGWWVTLAAAAAFGARGPSMLAFLNAIFGIGAIGAPLVFVAIGGDPALAFAVVAAMAVATFVLARVAPAPAAAALAAGSFRPRPGILGFGALAIGTEACLIGLGPTGLIARGVSEAGAAQLLSAFFAAFLLARLALVPLAGRIVPFVLLATALTVSGACAAGLAAGGPVWLFVAMGAAAGLFFPAFYMAGVGQMGSDARVAPTLIAAGLAGGISAPLIMGAVMGAIGNGILFALVAVLTLAAAAMAWPMVRAMRAAGQPA